MTIALDPIQRSTLLKAVVAAQEPVGLHQLAEAAAISVEEAALFAGEAVKLGMLQVADKGRGWKTYKAADGADAVLRPLQPKRAGRTKFFTSMDLLKRAVDELSACLHSKDGVWEKKWRSAYLQSDIYRRAAIKSLWLIAIHGEQKEVSARERKLRSLLRKLDRAIAAGDKKRFEGTSGHPFKGKDFPDVALDLSKKLAFSYPWAPLVVSRASKTLLDVNSGVASVLPHAAGRIYKAGEMLGRSPGSDAQGAGPDLAAVSQISRLIKANGEWLSSHRLRTFEDPLVLLLDAIANDSRIPSQLTTRLHDHDLPVGRINIFGMKDGEREELFKSVDKYRRFGNAVVFVAVDEAAHERRFAQLAEHVRRLAVPGAWALAEARDHGFTIIATNHDEIDRERTVMMSPSSSYGFTAVIQRHRRERGVLMKRIVGGGVVVVDTGSGSSIGYFSTNSSVIVVTNPTDAQLDDVLDGLTSS